MQQVDLGELEHLLAKATPGAWQAVGTDPAEGGDWFWLMAQPSPALRGFTKELGAINGSQSDPQQQANAALIVALRNAAPSLIATAREAEGLRALLARAYDMLFNSTAASEGDTTTIILERSEWLRLQEKLCRSALSEKGIHASDATDPGDSEVEGLRAEVARLKAERDTPQVANFTEAVHLEAAHQRARWGGGTRCRQNPVRLVLADRLPRTESR